MFCYFWGAIIQIFPGWSTISFLITRVATSNGIVSNKKTIQDVQFKYSSGRQVLQQQCACFWANAVPIFPDIGKHGQRYHLQTSPSLKLTMGAKVFQFYSTITTYKIHNQPLNHLLAIRISMIQDRLCSQLNSKKFNPAWKPLTCNA